MRTEEVYRKTKETEVKVKVNLDGTGKVEVKTGVPFLDHMMTSLVTHSMIDITAKVTGDLRHHSVEDLAISLGEALSKALGTREGIARFGYAAAPMDCSLAFAAVDLVKRPYFKIDLKLRGKKSKTCPQKTSTTSSSLWRPRFAQTSTFTFSTEATTTTRQKPPSKPSRSRYDKR
jgi:imidazoleglycerol phosphate dehydratase HisB